MGIYRTFGTASRRFIRSYVERRQKVEEDQTQIVTDYMYQIFMK